MLFSQKQVCLVFKSVPLYENLLDIVHMSIFLTPTFSILTPLFLAFEQMRVIRVCCAFLWHPCNCLLRLARNGSVQPLSTSEPSSLTRWRNNMAIYVLTKPQLVRILSWLSVDNCFNEFLHLATIYVFNQVLLFGKSKSCHYPYFKASFNLF